MNIAMNRLNINPNTFNPLSKPFESTNEYDGSVISTPTSKLNISNFWGDKNGFSQFQKDLKYLFNNVYDGTVSQEHFNQSMDEISNRYITSDMSQEKKETIAHTVGIFAKMSNQVVANQRIMNDPELNKMHKQLHEELMAQVKHLQETGSNAVISGSNPYKDWVNPKILKQFDSAEKMINQWSTHYSETYNLNHENISTPDSNFRNLKKEGLLVDIRM